jgi:hypothetical protein
MQVGADIDLRRQQLSKARHQQHVVEGESLVAQQIGKLHGDLSPRTASPSENWQSWGRDEKTKALANIGYQPLVGRLRFSSRADGIVHPSATGGKTKACRTGPTRKGS